MMPGESITPQNCADLIRRADRIVALTGAGVSTAAGIPDFRGPRGLYVTRQYDPETVFEIRAFHRDPEPFYAFTRDFLSMIDQLSPTQTHRFLADLEYRGKLSALVTQNIDPLHELAGSKCVLALHGDYASATCTVCRNTFDYDELREKLADAKVPRCSCGGVIKPDVVFFGESVRGFPEARQAVAESDLLLVLGSSLSVAPASDLPLCAGGEVVVVNQGPVALHRPHYSSDSDLDAFFRAVGDCL